jgi:hypothetical protein
MSSSPSRSVRSDYKGNATSIGIGIRPTRNTVTEPLTISPKQASKLVTRSLLFPFRVTVWTTPSSVAIEFDPARWAETLGLFRLTLAEVRPGPGPAAGTLCEDCDVLAADPLVPRRVGSWDSISESRGEKGNPTREVGGDPDSSSKSDSDSDCVQDMLRPPPLKIPTRLCSGRLIMLAGVK